MTSDLLYIVYFNITLDGECLPKYWEICFALAVQSKNVFVSLLKCQSCRQLTSCSNFWPGTNCVWKGHCLVFRSERKENHILLWLFGEFLPEVCSLTCLIDFRSTEVAACVNNKSPLSWFWQDAPRWRKPRPPGRRHTSQVPLAAFWIPQTWWGIAACCFQSHTRWRKIWAWKRLRRHVDWSRYWNHGNLWAKDSIFIQPRQRCLTHSLRTDVLLHPSVLCHSFSCTHGQGQPIPTVLR